MGELPTRPDPAWRAWYALEGDEPLEAFSGYLALARDMLGAAGAGTFEFLPSGQDALNSDLELVLIAIVDALDVEHGKGPMKLEWSRRRPGKPIAKHARARRGRGAAALVEKLVAGGTKQESALSAAAAEAAYSGLSRSEIMTWLRDSRVWKKKVS